jgi:hypothetical protein
VRRRSRFGGFDAFGNRVLLAGGALVVLAAGSAFAAGPAGASSPDCTSQATAIWLGDGEGGGAAGHVYYPIELSNTGRTSCTLYGYPGVSAWGTGGAQIGAPATRGSIAGAKPTRVTIPPRGTAHAIIAIADAGALCSKFVTTVGLKVYAPGETQAHNVDFGFAACASQKIGVLTIGPVEPGVGIPGYST